MITERYPNVSSPSFSHIRTVIYRDLTSTTPSIYTTWGIHYYMHELPSKKNHLFILRQTVTALYLPFSLLVLFLPFLCAFGFVFGFRGLLLWAWKIFHAAWGLIETAEYTFLFNISHSFYPYQLESNYGNGKWTFYGFEHMYKNITYVWWRTCFCLTF